MVGGNIDTRTYTHTDSSIKMDGWLSATVHNTGGSDVTVMGITVAPGESFVLGNATVLLYTDVPLKWPTNKGSVVVHYIEPIKC